MVELKRECGMGLKLEKPEQEAQGLTDKYAGVQVGTCVIVSGRIYEATDAIKGIGDGQRLEAMDAWIFPESKRAAVVAALPGCKTQRLRKRDFFERPYAQHIHSVVEWIEPMAFVAAWVMSVAGLVYFHAYTSAWDFPSLR